MHWILFKIGWRNVWRNPRRTAVLISTIAIGLFGFLGSIGFNNAFLLQMIDSSINLNAGHIQIAGKGFQQNPVVQIWLKDGAALQKKVDKIDGIKSAPRIRAEGMISSPEATSGIVLQGIDPKLETGITIVAKLISQGRYLGNEPDNEVIIGEKLASRLQVTLGEKIVIMTNDLENEIASAACRIVGLYRSTSTEFEKTNIFVHIKDAAQLLQYQEKISSISLHIPKHFSVEEVQQRLQTLIADPAYEILSWQDRFPVLVMSMEAFRYFAVIFIVIIFTAIAFTIINAYLMVIYERMHEIGVLLSIGIKPGRITAIMMIESLLVTIIGAGIGGGLSILFFAWFQRHGLDLSWFSAGLGQYGIGNLLYPEIATTDVVIGVVGALVIVLLATIYPARRASKFDPVDALNHI